MITLMHTDGCHLCEQAAALLTALNINFREVEIIDDELLVARFGTRIPVLVNERDECLDWPFDHDSIQLFLSTPAK